MKAAALFIALLALSGCVGVTIIRDPETNDRIAACVTEWFYGFCRIETPEHTTVQAGAGIVPSLTGTLNGQGFTAGVTAAVNRATGAP